MTRRTASRRWSEAAAVLRRHALHHDRDVGLAILRALSTCSAGALDDDANLGSESVRSDLLHATRVVHATRILAATNSAATLRAALDDELDLLRQRVFAGLALRYGHDEIDRVRLQLELGSKRSHALALEWLEVTLSPDDRATMPLLDPGVGHDELWRRLTRSFPLPVASAEQTLQDLINDPDFAWRRPWITACAMFTSSGLAEPVLDLRRSGNLARPGNNAYRPPGHIEYDHDDIVKETIAALRLRAAGTHAVQ